MIYTPASSFSNSGEELLQTTTILGDEGQAMVNVIVNGVGYATPSTGAAGEAFLGFSLLKTSAVPVLPTTYIKVEELVIPISGIVTASLTPLASTAFAYDKATGASIAVASVTGTAVGLGAINAGKTARIQYRYTLTAVQAQSLVGSAQPGGYSGVMVGSVGVGKEGTIYTSHFNSGVDFAAATAIKIDANGRLTDQTGAGTTIRAVVKSLPTVDRPFLGLEFSAL